jgi:putative DNA primase/helicase
MNDDLTNRSAVEWREERDRAEASARGKRRVSNGGGEGEGADSGPRPFAPIKGEDDGEIVLVNAADIEPESVNWLWPNGLQLGVLNLLAGRSTSGKSTIALSWSATITSGGQWPDGQACEPGRTIYWSGEDGIKDTLLPCFIAAGGDRGNMSFVGGVRAGERKRPFDPAADMPKLAQAVEKLSDVRMIVLDPIALVVKRDSHKNVETRLDLQPFADLCASRGSCGLGIHHFTKDTAGGDPLDRVSGSLAFGALPRCVWVAAKDLNVGKDARRVLMRVKISNGPDWGGFEYQLDRRELDGCPGIEAQRVLWGDVIQGTAKELLAQLESKPQADNRAAVFLRQMLKDGPQLAAEVIAKGKAEGLSEWALRRALKKLGGSNEKVDFKGPWIWELPK